MSRIIIATVVANKADKTITVKVDRRKTHRIYRKQITISNKLAVHDEKNQAKVGDQVVIEQSRPISKTKRWAVKEIIAGEAKS